jgi:hypothetical protein
MYLTSFDVTTYAYPELPGSYFITKYPSYSLSYLLIEFCAEVFIYLLRDDEMGIAAYVIVALRWSINFVLTVDLLGFWVITLIIYIVQKRGIG